MKLTKRDIATYLQQPAEKSRAVLFFGPDGGQVDQYRKQTLARLLGSPEDAMALTRLSGDKIISQPSLLFEAMTAMSLLGDAPVVTVEGVGDKATNVIKEALALPGSNNFLILTAEELPARSSLRNLFERDKSLAAYACYRDEGEGLTRFLEASLRERGIRTERDALLYLGSQLGNDRAVTLQEIEKISLYFGSSGTLSLSDAQLLVGGNDNFTLEDLSLAIGNANYTAVFTLTEKLLAEGTNAIAILRSCLRHFERLLSAKYTMLEGRGAEDAMNALKPPVFYKSKPAFGRQLSRLSEQKITRCLAILQQSEVAIKHSKDQTAYCLQALTLSCRSCS